MFIRGAFMTREILKLGRSIRRDFCTACIRENCGKNTDAICIPAKTFASVPAPLVVVAHKMMFP